MAKRKSTRKPLTPKQKQAKRAWYAAHPLNAEQRQAKRLSGRARRAACPRTDEEREAHRVYMLAWHAAHPLTDEEREENRLRSLAWYAAHAEGERKKHADYYAAHKEHMRDWQAAYNAAHPEQNKAQCKAWYAANREYAAVQSAAWKRMHPESRMDSQRRRRAMKAGAPINDFTAAQWVELQAACDHRCSYCGKRAKGHLTQDHIQALSKGGSHTLANIAPACRPCNSRKGAGEVLAPVQTMLLTLAPSKKKAA